MNFNQFLFEVHVQVIILGGYKFHLKYWGFFLNDLMYLNQNVPKLLCEQGILR